MTKKCMLARENVRAKAVANGMEKRRRLKKIIKSVTASQEEKEMAMLALQKMPRDSNPIRMRNRCFLTGRPRGYYRRFGLGRNKLREHAMLGDIPGLKKASW